LPRLQTKSVVEVRESHGTGGEKGLYKKKAEFGTLGPVESTNTTCEKKETRPAWV